MDDGGRPHAVGRLQARYRGSVEQGDAIKVFTRFDSMRFDPSAWRTARDDRNSGDGRHENDEACGGKGIVQAVA